MFDDSINTNLADQVFVTKNGNKVNWSTLLQIKDLIKKDAKQDVELETVLKMVDIYFQLKK